MVGAVRRHVEDLFGGQTAVFLAGPDGKLAQRAAGPTFADDPKELAVAQWVHEHSEAAGRGTATLAGAAALHLPLTGSRGPVGVLAVELGAERHPPGTDAMHLLETFANQVALALERALLARDAHRQRIAAEGERMRNALLAAVSHDLRTPLASITGAASSLASSDERLEPSARRELILTIHEEAQRMNRLANNLLEMGRLQAEGVTLDRHWQPIEEVIGSALNHFDAQLRGRELSIRVPSDLPLVEIDDVLIERVVLNLVDNVLKYTPPDTPIEIAARAGDGELVVEVSDRGPGFAPGEEERVFDKFFRGEASRTRHGAGLGLAVARAIVEAHGGRIGAENRPGGGAVFRFALPLGSGPPETEAAARVEELG
jgi:two-component system sensor histidine kinase KdpD